jgi:integrase
MVRTTATAKPAGRDRDWPSGPLRVKVYAGVELVTKRRHYLHETVAAGLTAHREAGKGCGRGCLPKVDERRNPPPGLPSPAPGGTRRPWRRPGRLRAQGRQARAAGVRQDAGRSAQGRELGVLLRGCCASASRSLRRPEVRRAPYGRPARVHRQQPAAGDKPLAPAVPWKWIAVNPADQADKPAMPAYKSELICTAQQLAQTRRSTVCTERHPHCG